MGKSIPSAHKLQQFARATASADIRPLRAAPSTHLKPVSKASRPTIPYPDRIASGLDPHQLRLNARSMEAVENSERRQRIPLPEVVADCVRRWFQDTLKEARNGDAAMQVLVGQMYYSGYGVAKDAQKGRAWINRASRSRSSVWKVGDKHPGYNASDSDSDDLKEDAK